MPGNDKCKICGATATFLGKSVIMKKHDISFFSCGNCGFVQTEEPYWLDEAYKNPVNISDTGYMQRNIQFSKILTALLSIYFNPRGKFLDYGGGYGVFVRLMRDIGFDFYWYDKYAPNLFSSGFEWNGTDKIEAVTAFEVLEHLVNPLVEIEKMFSISRNVIFSTILLPDSVPKPDKWWYYGLDHGQHISFYKKTTLHFLATKFNLNYVKHGILHIMTPEKISTTGLKLLLKINKIGLYNYLVYKMQSKTWEDHLQLTEKHENTF